MFALIVFTVRGDFHPRDRLVGTVRTQRHKRRCGITANRLIARIPAVIAPEQVRYR